MPSHPSRARLANQLLSLLAIAMALAGGAVLTEVHSSPAPETSRFLDLLSTEDLVVVGDLVDFQPVERFRRGFCGVAFKDKIRSWEITIRVVEVLVGSCPDSVVTLTTPIRFSYPPAFRQPGTRVLAFGRFHCEDDWSVWGSIALVRDDLITLSPGSVPVTTPGAFAPNFRYEVLASHLDVVRARSACELAGRAAALAVVRVRSRAAVDSTIVYSCDSVQVLVGHPTRVPVTLVFRAPSECPEQAQLGDSLLVPVPVAFGGGTLRLETCSFNHAVRYRVSRMFGLPLGRLSEAIRPAGATFQLIRIRSPS